MCSVFLKSKTFVVVLSLDGTVSYNKVLLKSRLIPRTTHQIICFSSKSNFSTMKKSIGKGCFTFKKMLPFPYLFIIVLLTFSKLTLNLSCRHIVMQFLTCFLTLLWVCIKKGFIFFFLPLTLFIFFHF